MKNRTSCAQLCEPAPTESQLNTLYDVAFRAADHRQLKPARFLQISGEGLTRLGELFLKARQATQGELTEEEAARARSLPTRAPMIIAIIANIQQDPKVPEIEQILSVGASVQNILNAAYALGLGVIWRTGELAFNPIVAQGLELADNEQLLGFLYIGTPRVTAKVTSTYDHQKHVSNWPLN